MDWMKKTLALLLALLLLAGCAQPGASSSSGLPGTSAQGETGPISPEELDKLDRLALFYEKACYGRAFSQRETVEADQWLALVILSQGGGLDPYWNEELRCWEVPMSVIERVNQYFFQNLSQMLQWERETTIGVTPSGEETFRMAEPGFSLVREEVSSLADGSIQVTYRRVREDQGVLTPVTYRFWPYTLETLPDFLEGFCQPGETLYLYLSVTQRPDLLPEDQPQTIEIATAEELLSAAKRINEGGYETRRDAYLLTADIDLAGVEWTPMGLGNRVLDYNPDVETERDPNSWGFNGTFDGQGHTIYNFTITQEQSAAFLAGGERNFPERELQGAAFFYRIGSRGVVKNLRLENADVAVPADRVYSSAAILAVECMGRLENVSVQGRVRGGTGVAGLTATLSGYFRDEEVEEVGWAENCAADVEVIGYSEVGGLVGAVHDGTISNCTAQGAAATAIPDQTVDDRMPGAIGGMVGHSVGGRAYDSGASVQVLTQVPSQWVGGFGGYWQSGGVFSCWVDGQKAASWKPVGFFYQTDPGGQEQPQVEVR